jgi:hypothetical protein
VYVNVGFERESVPPAGVLGGLVGWDVFQIRLRLLNNVALSFLAVSESRCLVRLGFATELAECEAEL